MNRNEAYEAMVAGKKITHAYFGEGFAFFENGKFKFKDGNDLFNSTMKNEDKYYIYEEPRKPQEWIRVTFKTKNGARPYIATSIYKNKEDFLKATAYQESDLELYHEEKVLL